MVTITCSCGQDLKLEFREPCGGQEGDKFAAFCPNTECRKRWGLTDETADYEEYVINETIPPENGEYKDSDGEWCYADGQSME